MVETTPGKAHNQPLQRHHAGFFRESTGKSRAYLDANPDMMFRIDKDGYCLDFKPAMEFEPYVPPSEFLGKKLSEVLPRSVASGAIKHIERALATKAIQTYEYTLPMGDELRHYEARITPLGEDEVLAIVRDITARRLPKSRTSKELELEARRAYRLTRREVGFSA